MGTVGARAVTGLVTGPSVRGHVKSCVIQRQFLPVGASNYLLEDSIARKSLHDAHAYGDACIELVRVVSSKKIFPVEAGRLTTTSPRWGRAGGVCPGLRKSKKNWTPQRPCQWRRRQPASPQVANRRTPGTLPTTLEAGPRDRCTLGRVAARTVRGRVVATPRPPAGLSVGRRRRGRRADIPRDCRGDAANEGGESRVRASGALWRVGQLGSVDGICHTPECGRSQRPTWVQRSEN